MPANEVIPWVSLGLSLVVAVIVPLVSKSIRSDMRDLVERHDANEHAHANMKVTSRLEAKIDAIQFAIGEIKLAFERAIFRHRGDES